MKTTTLLRTSAAVLLLWALAESASASDMDYDPSADFGDYSTYFLEEQVRGPAAGRLSSLDAQRIRSAVREAMTSEGFGVAGPRQADLSVRIHVGSEVDVVAVRVRPRRRGRGGRVRAVRDRDTVLTVELLDGGRTVWQAWEDFDFKADPQKRTAQIDKIVRGLFKKYPPTP